MSGSINRLFWQANMPNGKEKLLTWYAKEFGISNVDIAEAEWVADWVKRNLNSLCYDPVTFRYKWVDYAT